MQSAHTNLDLTQASSPAVLSNEAARGLASVSAMSPRLVFIHTNYPPHLLYV